jgi:hypothetical protein
MAEERITITIDEDGTIHAKTDGLKGEVCLEELKELLGNIDDYSSIKKTDEFHQQQTTSNRQTLKNKNT